MYSGRAERARAGNVEGGRRERRFRQRSQRMKFNSWPEP